MLSAKQSVVVQDCSRTRNNNELKKRQRSGRKQLKQTKKWKCWHRISGEKPLQAVRRSSNPRETVLQPARKKFHSSRETRHQLFNFARRSFSDRAKFWQNRTDRNDFARDQKGFRAKVQTSFTDSDWFWSDLTDRLDRLNRFLRPILMRKQRNKHVEQQASDSKQVWKQWARAKATLRMNNRVT